MLLSGQDPSTLELRQLKLPLADLPQEIVKELFLDAEGANAHPNAPIPTKPTAEPYRRPRHYGESQATAPCPERPPYCSDRHAMITADQLAYTPAAAIAAIGILPLVPMYRMAATVALYSQTHSF
jgi:hypothetical protein